MACKLLKNNNKINVLPDEPILINSIFNECGLYTLYILHNALSLTSLPLSCDGNTFENLSSYFSLTSLAAISGGKEKCH